MAANDIEVEIKLPLDAERFAAVKARLDQIARLVKNTHETDEYFTPAHRYFLQSPFPFEWLRVRKAGNISILNYKHYYPENALKRTHCDEFEVEIAQPDKLQKIFSALNFQSLVTVKKDRLVYQLNDEFEIALDTVNELGSFIEIEALKDFGGIGVTREKLIAFAQNLGVDVSKLDNRGYPYLLMEKKGLLKK